MGSILYDEPGGAAGAQSPRGREIVFVISGGGSTISTGVAGYLPIDFGGTIVQATAILDVSGDIVVDVWRDTYANALPTNADTITASAPITVTNAVKSKDSTLTGWTTGINQGDVLGFNVDSVSSATSCTVALQVSRSVMSLP